MTKPSSSYTDGQNPPGEFDLDNGLLDLDTPIEPLHLLKERAVEVSWLVDGLIPENNIVLLSGARGGFKTYLAWGLAVSIAIGDRFIDRETKKRNVLVFDAENPGNVIKRRAEQLGAPEGFFLWSRNMHPKNPPPRIDSPDGLAKYLRLVERYQPNPVLIFDTFSKFHAKKESSNDEMKPVMKNYATLREAGSTVIVLHHCSVQLEGGRPYKSRGAITIEDDSDAAYLLHKTAKGTLDVFCEKNRMAEVGNLTLKLTGGKDYMYWYDASVNEEEN